MMTETSITVSPTEGAPHVKSDPGQGQGALSWIRINLDYFKTLPGILKLVEILLGIICMACAAPARLPATNWFLFVVVISFIETTIWAFLYLLSIREGLKIAVNWPLVELLQSAITAGLYLTAFIVQLAAWSPVYYSPYKPASIAAGNNQFLFTPYTSYYSIYRDSNLTAGVFGLFNTLVYAAEAFFLYKEWKSNSPPSNA